MKTKEVRLYGGKVFLFAELARIIEKTNGLWSSEAEKYLLLNAKAI